MTPEAPPEREYIISEAMVSDLEQSVLGTWSKVVRSRPLPEHDKHMEREHEIRVRNMTLDVVLEEANNYWKSYGGEGIDCWIEERDFKTMIQSLRTGDPEC